MMLFYSNCSDLWRASECRIIAGGLHRNFLQYDCLLKGYTAFRVFSLQASFGLYGSWKTWNFIVATPGLVSPGKRLLVLESS